MCYGRLLTVGRSLIIISVFPRPSDHVPAGLELAVVLVGGVELVDGALGAAGQGAVWKYCRSVRSW